MGDFRFSIKNVKTGEVVASFTNEEDAKIYMDELNKSHARSKSDIEVTIVMWIVIALFCSILFSLIAAIRMI